MSDHKLTHIISDIPASHTEEFNFDAYAKIIADVIANKDNQTPLVVGIYGAWGNGKTSLMQTVRHLLQKEQYAEAAHYRRSKTVWFQAWKCAKEDEILAALIETIFKAMDEDDFFQWTKSQAEKQTKSIKTSKIVQVTFKLPQIPVDSFKSYIAQIAPRAAENIAPHLPVIMPVISHNPRQFKRFLNNVNLLEGLLRNSGIKVDFNHLLFWNMLDLVYPDLAKQCIENPASLELLQSHVQTLLETSAGDRRWDLSPEALKGVPKSFHPYVQDKKLVDLLDSFSLPGEQLISLCTMSQIVVSEEESLRPEPVKEVRAGLSEMVSTAAGPFLYGTDKQTKTLDKAFKIDIYPVSNRQFAAFIKDKGYEKDKFWSPEGLQWRTENEISKPEYWDDDKWNQPDHPVVGVNYYEAEAFA